MMPMRIFDGRNVLRGDGAAEPRLHAWACRMERIEVRPDRLLAYVVFSDERFCATSPGLVSDLIARFPHILSHACVNDRGETFMSVAAHTSTAHLLEHLAIDEQARLDETPSEVTFVGKTSWANRAKREACVQLSYESEAVARRSLATAQRELDAALLSRERRGLDSQR